MIFGVHLPNSERLFNKEGCGGATKNHRGPGDWEVGGACGKKQGSPVATVKTRSETNAVSRAKGI